MKINILLLISELHDKETVNNTIFKYLDDLNEKSNFSFFIKEKINDFYSDCDLSLIFVITGGSESIFLENYPKLKAPYYILTHGFSNSLAASIEILSFLNLKGEEGEILHGSHEYIIKRISELIEVNKNA